MILIQISNAASFSRNSIQQAMMENQGHQLTNNTTRDRIMRMIAKGYNKRRLLIFYLF